MKEDERNVLTCGWFWSTTGHTARTKTPSGSSTPSSLLHLLTQQWRWWWDVQDDTRIHILILVYLTAHSTHVGARCSSMIECLLIVQWVVPCKFVPHDGRKEMFLFNDALNTFYLRLYGVGHMVKDHSDSEIVNPLLPHRLLFPISSKGSFIQTIPQTG